MEEKYITEKLNDHEARIRRLEESDIEQKIKLTNIEKTQAEIKLMINEGNNKLLETLISNNDTRNSIRTIDRKELWAIVGLIIGGILAFFGVK